MSLLASLQGMVGLSHHEHAETASRSLSPVSESRLPKSRSEEKLANLAKGLETPRPSFSLPIPEKKFTYADGYVEAKRLPRKITDGAPRLHKRLVVCCDGTWNNGLARDPDQATNVLKLARCIFPEDRRTFPPIPQLVFYQTGLGTTEGLVVSSKLYLSRPSTTDTFTNAMSKTNITQGATGTGISAKIREAYAFIAQNYIPGDEVFLFGFSRGAFTARTIASLIADLGILTNAGMEDFYQVLTAYQIRGEGSGKAEKAEKFLDNYRHGGPKAMRTMPAGTLKCVGVWDTVGALGIPRFFAGNYNLLGFRDTKLSHRIKYAFHAIAINETRGDFIATKWELPSKLYQSCEHKNSQVVKQVWFSGSHSDVGGGNKCHDLSDISLIWMVANLMDFELLSIDEEYLLTLPAPTEDWGEMQPTETGLMILSSETARDVPHSWNPKTRETIHSSVACQKTLAPILSEMFANKESELIEPMLPFEKKMREKWSLFIDRSKHWNKTELESELESIDSGEDKSRRGLLFKELWATMLGALVIGRDTLVKFKGKRGDEALAYHALETPHPIE